MRRKEREVIDDVQIDGIIRKCKICRVGFYDNGEVYIVPLNFGFVHSGNKRIFYFHGAKEGRKFELIRHKPEVGFELDTRDPMRLLRNVSERYRHGHYQRNNRF